MLFLPIIAMVLYSCGSRSGNIEPTKLARVREVITNRVNWVRLNHVEASIYKVGDTVFMDTKVHRIYDAGTYSPELKKVYIESFEAGKN